MGRTETIKQRAIYVYLPSEEMAENWKKQAKKHKLSISKFVVATVESTLGRVGDETYGGDRDLREEVAGLRQELVGLRAELRQKGMYARSLESELRAARLDLAERNGRAVPNGEVDHSQRVVAVLQERRSVTHEELLESLGIGFEDVGSVEAVRAQLDTLAKYGLITYTGTGWRWVGRQEK